MTAETMSAIGLGQGHFMTPGILEENVVFWLRRCSMFLQRIEPNFGELDSFIILPG